MNPDSPRVRKSPRVSMIMVKQLSTVVVNGDSQESPQKIPEKPVDEEEKKKEIDPGNLGPDGALQYYSKAGDLEAMRKAYQDGAKVNTPDRGPVGTTPVEEGVVPNQAISGDYPLHMAVAGGHMPAVMELLNWEADIEAKNRIGSTALLRAISHEQLDIARRLLKDGASISVTNKIGNTALHCAAHIGSIEGAKLLIEYQAFAQINQPNLYGATPLMLAAKSSSSLCKYLLSLRSGKISTRSSPRESKVKTSRESKDKEDKENKETSSQRSSLGGEKRRSILTTGNSMDTVDTSIASPSLPESRQVAAPSITGESRDIELTSVVNDNESEGTDDR